MKTSEITFTSYAKAKRDLNLSYLGDTACSVKLLHSLENLNISTYGIYLAPADLSGYNVCPNSESCKELCLFGSGHNKLSILAGNNKLVNTRIKKTKLFFENRELFMQILIHEITAAKSKAEKKGHKFAVRINCTSDLNISLLNYEGKNICDIFPDVQFYDYTKVFKHLDNLEKFPNYDLTYSYNGYNWALCEKALERNVRVAVVFEKELPKTYHGYTVINGDKYDARYFDEKNVIVGLKYKTVANNYKDHKFVAPKTPFVVPIDSEFCER